MRLLVLLAWIDVTAPAMAEKVRCGSNLALIAPQPILGPGAAMPDQTAYRIVIRAIAPLHTLQFDRLALRNFFAQFRRHVPAHSQEALEQFIDRIRCAPLVTAYQEEVGATPFTRSCLDGECVLLGALTAPVLD